MVNENETTGVRRALTTAGWAALVVLVVAALGLALLGAFLVMFDLG